MSIDSISFFLQICLILKCISAFKDEWHLTVDNWNRVMDERFGEVKDNLPVTLNVALLVSRMIPF